jgi:hypothetical protein
VKKTDISCFFPEFGLICFSEDERKTTTDSVEYSKQTSGKAKGYAP